MGKKRKPKPMDLPNPLVVDEDEFGRVVTKMLNTEPVTLKEIVKKRRKNPETDPRYLPVFDFSRTIHVSHEDREDIKETDKLNREFRKKK